MKRMNTQELTSYIATERARGVTDADIKTQLLTTGWKEIDVNAALESIGTPEPTSEVPRDFSFRKLDVGRIARLQYFFASILMCVLGLAFIALFVAGGTLLSREAGGIVSIVFIVLIYIVMLIFGVCLGIRRLHDMNMSGWWILVLVIPGVGTIFGLFMLFMPGTKAPNKYGNIPDSKRSIWKTLINT